MYLIIIDPVHQWQGDNDAVKSHSRLYDVFTVELASNPSILASSFVLFSFSRQEYNGNPKLSLVKVLLVDHLFFWSTWANSLRGCSFLSKLQ